MVILYWNCTFTLNDGSNINKDDAIAVDNVLYILSPGGVAIADVAHVINTFIHWV